MEKSPKDIKKLMKMCKKAEEEAKKFKSIFRKTYPLLSSREKQNLNCVYSYYMWKKREKQAKLLREMKSKMLSNK